MYIINLLYCQSHCGLVHYRIQRSTTIIRIFLIFNTKNDNSTADDGYSIEIELILLSISAVCLVLALLFDGEWFS